MKAPGITLLEMLRENDLRPLEDRPVHHAGRLTADAHCRVHCLLCKTRVGTAAAIGRGSLRGMVGIFTPELRPAAQRLRSREWLIFFTDLPDRARASDGYREGLAIDCLFGDGKTVFFYRADSRICGPDKLSRRLVHQADCFLDWGAKKDAGTKAIRRKFHG